MKNLVSETPLTAPVTVTSVDSLTTMVRLYNPMGEDVEVRGDLPPTTKTVTIDRVRVYYCKHTNKFYMRSLTNKNKSMAMRNVQVKGAKHGAEENRSYFA